MPTELAFIVVLLFGLWCLLIFCAMLDIALGKKVATPELWVYQQGRKPMSDVLTYAVSAPAPVDADVVGREVTVVVNGLEQPTYVVGGLSTDLGTVEVPQDAEVVIRLVDVDDAGNRSEPAEVAFVAVDTLPPATPGTLGVSLVSERRDSAEEGTTPEA